jgi:hypothetical protein
MHGAPSARQTNRQPDASDTNGRTIHPTMAATKDPKEKKNDKTASQKPRRCDGENSQNTVPSIGMFPATPNPTPNINAASTGHDGASAHKQPNPPVTVFGIEKATTTAQPRARDDETLQRSATYLTSCSETQSDDRICH